MAKLFNKIRKNLISEKPSLSRTSNYLKYAFGEILLVVIGILIALAINNWKEEQKSKKEFNFVIKEFYKRTLIGVYSYGSLIDRDSYQVSKMDSIIDGKASEMNLEHLPGTIQIFDDNLNYLNIDDTELQNNFLKLKPGDDMHNGMVRTIRKYFDEASDFQNKLSDVNMNHLMITYLRNWNIPVRFLYQGTSYAEFINNYPNSFYSKADLSTVLQLTKDKSFIADLKSLRYLKLQRIFFSKSLGKSGQRVLEDLKKDYPNLDFEINHMEIIGTATQFQDWTTALPMKQISKNVWEITIDLTDGDIKFRTDGAWTFDWGRSEFDPNNLVFKGGDIPVKKGKYHVTINIANNTFKLIKINN